MKWALLVPGAMGLLACLHGAGGHSGRFRPRPSDPACLEKAGGVAPEPRFGAEDLPVAVRTCDGQRVYETPGAAPISDEQFGMLHQRLGRTLMNLPGVEGPGMGLCCVAEPGARGVACLSVYVDLCTTPVEDVVRPILAAAHWSGLDGARVTFRIAVGGPKGPRCRRNDSRCEPVAYEHATYWPDCARYPVHEQVPELGELSGGSCEHDGECVGGNGSNFCVPWHRGHMWEDAVRYRALEAALCGCVDHQCTWFTQ